jgi:hypothetical protein
MGEGSSWAAARASRRGARGWLAEASDAVVSIRVYEGPLVRAILLLKWERMEPLGDWFRRETRGDGQAGEWAAGDGRGRAGSPAPGPRTAARVPASLISKSLARKPRVPHTAVLLMRTRPRPDKRVLSF